MCPQTQVLKPVADVLIRQYVHLPHAGPKYSRHKYLGRQRNCVTKAAFTPVREHGQEDAGAPR
jgi:hypothetical protein